MKHAEKLVPEERREVNAEAWCQAAEQYLPAVLMPSQPVQHVIKG